MARWCFVNGFVRPLDATQCSGSAGTATADNVTAAMRAAWKPGAGSDAVPTVATSGVPKGGSITATGNANTAVVAPA
jgi:hypothetical protein